MKMPLPFAAIALTVASTVVARAENWPGWRGPARNGVTTETNLPLTWSATENVLWKTPLPGYGIANPIVWGNRVFLVESDGPKLATLHVICLALDSGKELWHRRMWGTAPTLHHGNKSSMASPSPVTDGKHIYAFFGTGDVFCLTVAGELVWQRSLADEYGPIENRFAASSSLLLQDGLVFLQCDHYGASYVLAIDAATGANRWKADRPECWLSWASPQLVPVGEGYELIVSGSHKVDAYAPKSGEKLWTLEGMARECIPTPVYGNGLVYVVSGPKSPTFAIRPGGRGNLAGSSRVVWSNPRGAPFVPSTILVGERYYLVDDKGIATCLDARDGRSLWQKRLSGAFTASSVAGDGKVYFVNEQGTTTVIRAGVDDYEELAANDLGEPVFASPALSQGRVFIRTAKHLFCIGGESTTKNGTRRNVD